MADRPALLILGTYHMANPGLDAVNFEADDVLSPQRQREIELLVAGLAEFRPTKIAVEVTPADEGEFRARYDRYVAGTYELGRGETEQIGFRLAKHLGHATVFGVDWNEPAPPGVDVDFQSFAAEHGQGDLLSAALDTARRMMQRNEQIQAEATIADVLRSENDPDNLSAMHRIYLQIARIGTGDRDPGANWVAHWYGRNLKIYVNLTRLVDTPNERILLVIGSGPTVSI